jgi:tRNA modification GTPase
LDDTIAAVSSAVGPAARLIVRASGRDVPVIIQTLCPASPPAPSAARTILRLSEMRLPIWLWRFPAGHSYTGDELAEFHIPGNPLLARLLLEELIRLGARAAEPGEFTARAYFNGRMDLSQAEGVAAMVSAANSAELDAARRLMAGELSCRLRPALEQIAGLLALLEAEIDFSDSDVRFVSAADVSATIAGVIGRLSELLRQSSRFARLSHEPRVVLAGRPNAGKSTLLNALSASARAIVSPVAGTTRDALSAQVALNRGMIWLVDMAGLDESAAGEIETHMRRRALLELERADSVVLVRDITDTRSALDLSRKADLTVLTKADLAAGKSCGDGIPVSAVCGQGMDELRNALDNLAFGTATSGELALTVRHEQSIESAVAALKRGGACTATELAAAELRTALDFLGQVLGEVTPNDILGRVFSSFCIGK